jgi:F-box/WD-40 domain protein MET30
MCSQHIDKTCTKCGWGLPLMTQKAMLPKRVLSPSPSDPEAKRYRPRSNSTSSYPQNSSQTPEAPASTSASFHHLSAESTANLTIDPLAPMDNATMISMHMIKNWKQIYAERSVVAGNWRKPQFTSKNLIGHTDGYVSM